MTLSSFTLRVDFSTSHCSAPSPRCQASRLLGFTGNSVLPGALLFRLFCRIYSWEDPGQFFPFYVSNTATGDFDVSPCREEKKGQKCFRDGGQKSFEIMPSTSSVAWSLLYVLWNEKWILLASLSLPRPHPALSSWQCQHSHAGITVKIASFSFDNKIQQPFGIPVAPQSPDPWLGPRGFVVGC